MTTLIVPNIIKRAERLPNGRIKGVGPPRLVPTVVRHLSTAQMFELQTIHAKQRAVSAEMRRFLAELGLDYRRNYRFRGNGEVREVGRNTPVY